MPIREYYVKQNGVAGADGLSPETAFSSIRQATFVARAGDVVYIGPGLYQDDPLIARHRGHPGVPVTWIGDPFGVLTRTAAGDVRIPYYDCGPGDTRYNICWFIDFFDRRDPTFGDGGGMTVRLQGNDIVPGNDPWSGTSNRWAGTSFISCKIAGQTSIYPHANDKPDGFYRAGFRSCVMGYGFPSGTESKPTVLLRNKTIFTGPGPHNSGMSAFYGCTILAGTGLGPSDWVIHCFNISADTMPVPPNPSGTPKYLISMSLVNTIVDATPSTFNSSLLRLIGRDNTASFNVRLTSDFNIYRKKILGSFSDTFPTLPEWQTASVIELGDQQIYIDSADDKLKFKLALDSTKTSQGGFGGGVKTINSTSAFVINQWYHIACSWDRPSGEMKINIDGTDINTATHNGHMRVNDVMGSFGGCFYPIDRSLRGFIDEIRVWNDRRTDAEVATLRSTKISDPESYPNLYRYYPLDEGQGLVAEDKHDEDVTNFGTRDADITGATYDVEIPFGASGFSLNFVSNSFITMGVGFPVDSPINVQFDPTSSFTVEMWVRITTLPSVVGEHAILMTKGATVQDGNSVILDDADLLFEADGYHLLSTATQAIDTGLPVFEDINWGYSGDFDVDGDGRPNGEHVDIGADEYYPAINPDHSSPYGFSSKIYAFIRDGLYPNYIQCNYNHNTDFTPEGTMVCGNTAPAGGWSDHIRIICTFRPMELGKWIEILNTQTGLDRRLERIQIPNSFRGPHFQVKFEILPNAVHLGKFDLGEDFEDAATQSISQDDVNFNYPPGCELDIYNFMFKELVNRAVVDGNGNWSVDVWPGTYYIRPHGQDKFQTIGEEYVTVGFSDYYAPFGGTHCAIPFQVDWAEFENQFMGTDWSTWYVKEQFIDEEKRISTELPDAWPEEDYAKKALVRCGRLLKSASWVSGFQVYGDPTLNLEGYQRLFIWDFTNIFIPYHATSSGT